VSCAPPGTVRLGDVDPALAVQADQRVGVVHHRGAPLGGRDVVVRHPERVPDLVRHVLAPAGHRELLRRHLQPVLAGGGNEAHVDVVVHQRAVGVHPDHRGEDLAGARVAVGGTHRGAALLPVHPVDDGVAGVHGIDALGKELDPEGVAPPGRLEDAVPPVPAVQEGAPVRLRHRAVQVVDDRPHRLDELAPGVRRRVGRLQPPAHHPALPVVGVEALGEVEERRGVDAGAGVERADRQPGLRQLHEAVVLLQGDRPAVRRVAPQLRVRLVGHVGQDRADLRVEREGPRVLRVDVAALAVHPQRAHARGADAADHVVDVAQEEVRGVHDHDAALRALDGEGGEHRLGERLLHAAPERLVAADRAVVGVRADQEDPGSVPLEADDGVGAGLAAVEPRARGAEPGGEGVQVEHLLAEPRDGQQHPAGSRVVADGEQLPPGPGGGRRDRGGSGAVGGSRGAARGARRKGGGQRRRGEGGPQRGAGAGVERGALHRVTSRECRVVWREMAPASVDPLRIPEPQADRIVTGTAWQPLFP
jgi:hypothetical protein